MNNLVKENTKNFIVEQAIELFLKKSIAGVTISDIARHVGVGEATLYRYFQKKQNIVMQASAKLADKVLNDYSLNGDAYSGYEQLSLFYNTYLNIFKNKPQYFRFIDELDAYLLTEKDIQKSEYESEIEIFKNIFDKSYEKGVEDGSVKILEDKDAFYYSTAHALLNLCKSLASAAVLKQDEKINKEQEIKTLIDVILYFVKK